MNLYVVSSVALNKKWVTQARDVEDATGKVLSYARDYVSKLMDASAGPDINLDIKVSHIEIGITEI